MSWFSPHQPFHQCVTKLILKCIPFKCKYCAESVSITFSITSLCTGIMISSMVYKLSFLWRCLQSSLIIRTGGCCKKFLELWSISKFSFSIKKNFKNSRLIFVISERIFSRWSFIFTGFMASLLKAFSHNGPIRIVSLVNESMNQNFKYSCEYCQHFLALAGTIVLSRNEQIETVNEQLSVH